MVYLPLCVSAALACAYAGLAGFSIPTQRACIFALVLAANKVLGRNAGGGALTLFTACIVVGLDPFASISPSFWLSFVAVLVLFYCFSNRFNKRSKILSFFQVQILCGVSLIVPLVVFSLPLSVVSPLANGIAVPVVSVIVIPLLAIGTSVLTISESLANQFFTLANWFLTHLMHYLNGLESWHPAMYRADLNQVSKLMAIGLGTLMVFAPKGLVLRGLGLCLLISGLISTSAASKEKEYRLKITVLDVGQGLSIAVTYGKSTIVYDAGPRFSDSFDAGSRIIVPYLRSQHVDSVNALIVSHTDLDHAGGLGGLLNTINVDQLYSSEPETLERLFVHDFHKAKAHAEFCAGSFDFLPSGEYRKIPNALDGLVHSLKTQDKHSSLRLSFLSPEKNYVESLSKNDTSCVVLLEYKDFSILLPGDISSRIESELLESGRLPTNVDVLIAPHHGSKTSSSIEFLRALAPKNVVFSAGYNNRYHHPAKTVRNRYIEEGVSHFTTGDDGAVVIELDSFGRYSINTERKTSPKLWY